MFLQYFCSGLFSERPLQDLNKQLKLRDSPSFPVSHQLDLKFQLP